MYQALNEPRVEDGIPRRQFTVVNNCAEQIRLGATGGFVKSLADKTVESCPDGSVLDEAVSLPRVEASIVYALPDTARAM